MMPKVHNLFSSPDGKEEEIHQLLQGHIFTLEHIVSRGQSSDADFWYNQAKEEWVALINGRATLEFRTGEMLPLAHGDCLLIPAHCEHRVASTSSDAHWLALHFDSSSPEND